MIDSIIVTEDARDALYARSVEYTQTAKYRNGQVRLEVGPNLYRQLTLQLASGETLSDVVLRLYRQ